MQPLISSNPGVVSHTNKESTFVNMTWIKFRNGTDEFICTSCNPISYPASPCNEINNSIAALEFELNVDKNETKEKIYKTKSSSVSTVLICPNPILMSIFSH